MTPLFAAESVGKAFRGVSVLTAASVRATAGAVTLLAGRNGCGKSTLLRIGAGVLAADHGVVRFAGEAWERPRLHRLARLGLFYLPDRGLLSRRLMLRQHLAALEWHFGTSAQREVLADLEIERLLDERPDTISGGERRRAEVALAALRAPRCLLADEPLMGIAPADAERIARALRRLADGGCAVVVTGHEVPELLALADQVVWMIGGTTHDLGTPGDAAAHEYFRRQYLGTPAVS
ncbi:MAG TPA: ATP-binding cassette domain-containing protein [Longimicrobiales bacterium]